MRADSNLASTAATWLMAIARNKALSALRRRTDVGLDETIECTVTDPADNPEVALQKKNRGDLLHHALASLSPKHVVG
jgi:RNA polymerase sigma-70 factor (ECF subfamily)